MNTMIKHMLWGGAIACVATLAVGFGYYDWKTNSTATHMAQASAQAATVDALTPRCVENAMAEPDKVAALQAERSSYRQRSTVEEAGWSTVEDSATSSLKQAVNRACADALNDLKPAEQASG